MQTDFCVLMATAGPWSIYYFGDDSLGAVSGRHSRTIQVAYTSLDLAEKSPKRRQQAKKVEWVAMGALLANA